MARTKISKVAKDLNIGISTVVDFLSKKGITVDENPNTRLEDNEVELLFKEFKPGHKPTPAKVAEAPREKQEEEKAPAAPQPAPADNAAPRSGVGPKVVGRIDLDSKNNPIIKREEVPATTPDSAQPESKTEDKKTDAPKAEDKKPAAPKAPETKPEPRPEPQKQVEQPAPEVKAPAPQKPTAEKQPEPEAKPEPKKPAVKPAPENKAEKVAAPERRPQPEKAEKPAEKPAQEKPAAEKTEKTEPEVFTLGGAPEESRPKLNIIGKIDLSSLNQSTRPKKKSKEEKRRERNDNAANRQPGAAAGTAQQGDRKKRKRINGKEKVDIEKTSHQSGNDNRGQGNRDGGNNNRNRDNQGGGSRGRGNGPKDRKPQSKPVHTEVNEEDVQKQVKETLARLTQKDKNQKKGVKWRKEKREAFASREREAAEHEEAESRTLKLTEFVTANDLASMMNVPVNNVIATCMNLGVMVSINQRLDAETINIVAEEFGFKTEYVSAEVVEAIQQEEDTEDQLQPRSPIVTVMGHVDHGKTSLLDYIRNANVIAGEAGGITQHIGAYNVKMADGRHITFLDTPGHEAFTAMRARGAKVTDLVIIIVAADDNVMPQTIEAINHASAAGVPIVFAINKIDKPAANPDKIKEELANMNYLVEDWGGKYQSQDISAKKGTGVEELMEKVLLEAEMLELKANPNRRATGSIIESSLDKGRGYVATVLVQNGTLRQGDVILAGTHHGKIRAMFNERNQRIKEAGPAEPALILGLDGAPTAGDTFNVLDSEQEAREIATKRQQLQRELGMRTKKILTLEDIGRRRAIGNFQELNIIVKGDVDGSIEALSDSLIKLSTPEIQINVLHKAVGAISESDVTLAAASDAIIIGFQVRPSVAARREAEREGVEIRLYSVIYQAIEEVKDAMEGMLAPEIKEEVTGTAEVLQTYKISRVGTVAGCIVREGRIKRSCSVRLIRDGIVRYTGELGSLKRFKDDVKEVVSGYDCGLNIAGYNDIQEGDIIEAFEEVEVKKTL